jgi:hypothetical protein
VKKGGFKEHNEGRGKIGIKSSVEKKYEDNISVVGI